MQSFKNRLIILDTFLYFVTIAYLYHIHYKVYGSTIDMAFHVIVWVPVISFVIHFFFDKWWQSRNKNLNNNINIQILFWLFFGCIFVIVLFCLLKSPYILSSYYYIGIFIAYLIETIMIKNKQRVNEIVIPSMFIIVLIITVTFRSLCGIYTLSQAKEQLQKDQYVNIQWIGASSPEMVSTLFSGTANLKFSDLTWSEKKMDFYLFYGEKNQKKFGLYFSPSEGTIRQYEVRNINSLNNSAVKK